MPAPAGAGAVANLSGSDSGSGKVGITATALVPSPKSISLRLRLSVSVPSKVFQLGGVFYDRARGRTCPLVQNLGDSPPTLVGDDAPDFY